MTKKQHKPYMGNGTLSRRQLLTALGLTGAGLFLPSLGWRRGQAKAQAAEPIRRVVIFVSGHGVVPETWRMRRDHPDFGNWEYPFDNSDPMSFSETLRPLHAHREKLLVIEGLSQMSTLGDYSTNNHAAGTEHILTAAKMINDNTAGGPSVDQIIANAVSVPGRIPSLELASLAGFPLGGYVNIAAGQRAPLMDNPQAIFDRLFPPGSIPTGGEPQEPTERERIRAARPSVLDLAAGEYETIAPRLGAEDRARLDQHRQMIRDLELRIGSIGELSCDAPPERPSITNNVDQLQIIRAEMELVAAAFACDLTRVATVQVAQFSNEEFGAPPGDVHQDFAHQTHSSEVARQQMTNYNRVNADLFAHLLAQLDRYTEGDGTLLDNTAAIWMNELATGPHELWQIPVVMAGSCGGKFRVGRYMSYAQDIPNPVEHPEWEPNANFPLIGPGHSHLYVSLMQAMGLPNNEIGMTSVQTRDAAARTISLTGPLDRLT